MSDINIDKLVVDFWDDLEEIKEARQVTSIQDVIAFNQQVLDAIKRLERSVAFRNFKTLVVDPDLKVVNSRLRNEKELADIYTLQGSATVLEKYFNLDFLKKYHSAIISNAQARINTLTEQDNAKKENN